ncbi:MAG: hypothetical protein Homavirus16_9 [Homavirus sp.]|uniref:Uncharacterized protein n=1 Tax=Homavirus sp. TaxID=2487769 RepID=A0A3G5A4P4_9VIRU|nr:MAG: hypothetical protein Homavirus16_9 [Homavirus sp.]
MEDLDIESAEMIKKVKFLARLAPTEELEEKAKICVLYSSNPLAESREFDCNWNSTGSPRMVMKPPSFHSAYELYTLGMFPRLRNGNSFYYQLMDLNISYELTLIASAVLQNDSDGADLLTYLEMDIENEVIDDQYLE